CAYAEWRRGRRRSGPCRWRWRRRVAGCGRWRRARPGGVGGERSGWLVSPRAVGEGGPDGLAGGVVAVGGVGLLDRFGAVGEEGVVAPDREQRVLGVGVEHWAYDQAGGDRMAFVVGEGGVGDLGDLRFGDQLPGVRVDYG